MIFLVRDSIFGDGKEDSVEEVAEVVTAQEDEIKEKLGFTVNVGIGNSKVCAKMASDFEKPDKVHTLFSNEIKDKLCYNNIAV